MSNEGSGKLRDSAYVLKLGATLICVVMWRLLAAAVSRVGGEEWAGGGARVLPPTRA